MTKEQFINAHPNIKINNTMFLNEDGFRDFTEEELINLCSISFDNASKLFMYIYMYDYEKYYKKMLITISKTSPLFFDISNINDINENSFDDKRFDYNVISVILTTIFVIFFYNALCFCILNFFLYTNYSLLEFSVILRYFFVLNLIYSTIMYLFTKVIWNK